MPDHLIDRLGAATGALSVMLGVAAVALGGAAGAANPGASAQDIAQVYASPPTPMLWFGAYLEILAYLLLLVFVARLWEALRPASGKSSSWLATAAAGAGMLSVTLTLAGFAIGTALRYRGGPTVDSSSALALFDVHVALYVASWALAAVFLGATAVAVLTGGALPRWLGWTAGTIAVFDLVAVGLPTTPLVQFPSLLLLLWVLMASIVLLRRPATSPAIVEPARAMSTISRTGEGIAG